MSGWTPDDRKVSKSGRTAYGASSTDLQDDDKNDDDDAFQASSGAASSSIDHVVINYSDKFTNETYNIRVIIDCFEIPLNMPGNNDDQRAYFSSYKNRHTLKFLIALDARTGRVCFISDAFPGCISDDLLCEASGIAKYIARQFDGEKLPPAVLADKGFVAYRTFERQGVRLVTPAMLREGRFTSAEAIFTRRTASVRIFIECAIRATKVNAQLHRATRTPQALFTEQLVWVAALLTNFKKPFAAKNEEDEVGEAIAGTQDPEQHGFDDEDDDDNFEDIDYEN